MRSTHYAVTLAMFAAVAAVAPAQTGSDKLPSFEVASVTANHENTPDPGHERLHVNPGSLSLMNASLRFCVQWAYGVPEYQLSGPGWLRELKFDIAAKTSTPSTEAEMRRMMQTLLAERFKLVLHRETKPLDVYEMRVAKRGLKLTKADIEETGEIDDKNREGFYAFHHVTMAEFAQQIRNMALHDPVVDHTGIQGRYDMTLRFPAGYRPTPQGFEDMPPVMVLVEEQFGLTMELKKLPIEILVVDSVEKSPIEN
jgi:uncharacterized protein (TIGR03435 family)